MSPIYEFHDVETGEHVELFMHMGAAPRCGEVGRFGERLLRRLVSKPQTAAKATRHFTARQFAPYTPGAKHYNEHGEPCFDSQREVDEFTSKWNAENPHETVEYDAL